MSPEYLELALSERVLMKNADSTVSALKALKKIGVGLSVDDSGMGASSLSHLAQFPIDSLTVDQSFVHETASRSGDAISVRAVINIGDSLSTAVIAGGVDTPEPLDFLIGADCEAGQGYYRDPPMPAEEFRALLEAGTSEP